MRLLNFVIALILTVSSLPIPIANLLDNLPDSLVDGLVGGILGPQKNLQSGSNSDPAQSFNCVIDPAVCTSQCASSCISGRSICTACFKKCCMLFLLFIRHVE